MSVPSESVPILRLGFVSKVIEWRGPAPFYFAAVPAQDVQVMRMAARSVSYGWGMVPVQLSIGETTTETALFPKDDGYLIPLKLALRKQTNIAVGDMVHFTLEIHAGGA